MHWRASRREGALQRGYALVAYGHLDASFCVDADARWGWVRGLSPNLDRGNDEKRPPPAIALGSPDGAHTDRDCTWLHVIARVCMSFDSESEAVCLVVRLWAYL